jgi:hypothetical protein
VLEPADQKITLERKKFMSIEDEKQKVSEDERKKKKKEAPPLPLCTTAADPEHHKGEDNDEPCDDYREGNIEAEETVG